MDDRSDMLAAQCGRKSAWHETVDDLYMFQVACGPHNFDECAVEWQCALLLSEMRAGCLAEKLRLFPAASVGIACVHSVNVLHDR